jgi:hypothetical protein
VNAWVLLVPLAAILALDLIAVTLRHREQRDAPDAEPVRERGDGPHRGPGGMWRL